MGTKNNPSTHDCYANLKPDEPYFLLMGRDPMGPALTMLWAQAREANGEDQAKVKEARECAREMARWALKLNKKVYLPGDLIQSGAIYRDAVMDAVKLLTSLLTGNAAVNINTAIQYLKDEALLLSAWYPTHRHHKGGLYRYITDAKLESTEQDVVVYEAEDGTVWVRLASEFQQRDRFEPLPLEDRYALQRVSREVDRAYKLDE